MKTFRVLTIDGGGIRGVIPAKWLEKIESRLDKKIYESFDMVVGTSTGSILCAAVSLGKDIKQSSELYNQFGNVIFPKQEVKAKFGWFNEVRTLTEPEYPEIPLAETLQKFFAIDTKLSACKIPTVIISYDVFRRHMFLMKSYDAHTDSIPVWEACKASSSAPTYFPAHILKHSGTDRPLIDGGVFANNPTIMAVSEAIRLKNKNSIRQLQEDTRIQVVSLGTGNLQRPISIDQAVSWGSLSWIKPIIDVMYDSSSEHSHFCAHHILTDENYVRLQVDLNGVNDNMDDGSAENINELRNLADGLFDTTDGQAKLDRIVEMLTNE